MHITWISPLFLTAYHLSSREGFQMAFQSCCLVSRGSFPKVERSRVLSNPLLPYRLLTSVTSPTTPKGENPPLSTTQTKISKSLQLEQHFYPLSPLPTQKKVSHYPLLPLLSGMMQKNHSYKKSKTTGRRR